MRLDEPAWWYSGEPDRRGRWLAPVGSLYGKIVERRYRAAAAYRARLPVICIGNFTLGGTGKTPLAILIARMLRESGETPVFLTRGYGGSEAGPLWVDPAHAVAAEVGDEPLLLAGVAPTMIARDRREGAQAIERSGRGASVIVMDDGLQNPALAKTFTLAVVDATRGFGNGWVFPAGPLRARLAFQLGLADAIVCNTAMPLAGDGETLAESDILIRLRRSFPGPVLESGITPREPAAWLSKQPVIAFSGIGNPARFFNMVDSLGATVIERVEFPDHYNFSETDAGTLLHKAETHGAVLVTTEKDLARLRGAQGEAQRSLAAKARAVGIEATFPERDFKRLSSLLDAALSRPRTGSGQ